MLRKNVIYRRLVGLLSVLLILVGLGSPAAKAEQPKNDAPIYDVVVYGGSPAGVSAAIAARRLGKTVVLIEPGQYVGGLTSGGLGATDIGNKTAIGGISREFYRNVKTYYEHDSAWRFQQRDQYKSRRRSGPEDTMWTFEPHVAEKILRRMLAEAKVPVIFGELLDRKQGVTKTDGRITSIATLSGKRFRGRCFIDATYEGDLLAAAGVSFTVGREANAKHGETINGVQTLNAVHHQFVKGVDPYRKQGDPNSGLLPGLHDGPPGAEGSGDDRVQAYNLRMCVTDAPGNRLAFEKPEGYDALDYELLLRNFEAGETAIPWSPTPMPNRKTDTNNKHGFSTDFIGESDLWPEASYQQREQTYQRHLQYQRGLMWTLANHPRVPEAIRQEISRWGNCRDEFSEHQGWSHQLYVREGRRMVSAYVMNQHDCQARREANDVIALAAYTMDSHNVQRYVDSQGQVRNEGDVQVGGFAPFPISYRSIVPRKDECQNLLVPVCLSASHIAYGSIRMEPVFMVMGQSAATAASIAIDRDVAVQDIDYAELREQMLKDKQVLIWTGRRPTPPIELASLKGIVVDDLTAELTGAWKRSRSVGNYVANGYLHDDNQHKGECSAIFRPMIPRTGSYEIRIAYTPNPNRASALKVVVNSADGTKAIIVDQKKKPPHNGFFSLGTFRCTAGDATSVSISNADTDGYVIVDAVQWLPAGEK